MGPDNSSRKTANRLSLSKQPTRNGRDKILVLGLMQFLMVLLSAVLAGCSGFSAAKTPSLELGEDYRSARQRLIVAGWTPVAAECSHTNLCFDSSVPEMATDMKTGAVCPVFTKASSQVVVCLKVINDGALIKSFQNQP